VMHVSLPGAVLLRITASADDDALRWGVLEGLPIPAIGQHHHVGDAELAAGQGPRLIENHIRPRRILQHRKDHSLLTIWLNLVYY